jgi:ribonuclease BN (tRNA processing enzyme)
MQIQFYGTRGSYSVPGKSTLTYGGNTSCVSISEEGPDGKIQRIIIDAGTGIIQLGRDIITNHFKGVEDIGSLNIFFTHLHPDHNQGFPFFAPNFFRETNITLYGMETLKKNVARVLANTIVPPQFPIEWKDLKSHRAHFTVRDGETIKCGLFSVKVMQAFAPSHPQQGAIYYRVTNPEGKSVACIWDNESKIGGDQAVIAFSKGADVMIHDTQYTDEEYSNQKMVVQGFGHSTYTMALDNAKQAGVGQLVGTHFNPTHSDDKLDTIQAQYPGMVLAKEGNIYKVV